MDYAASKEIIHSTDILSSEDAAYIDRNIDHIQAVWEKRQVFRTETEMRVSVLNDVKFPTPSSKYWQCVREQAAFYDNLVGDSFSYRRSLLKLKKIRRKMDSTNDELKLEGLQIDLEQTQFSILSVKQQAVDRMREIRLWDTLMKECIQADNTFDTENVDTHQLISYLWRWHHQKQGLEKSESPVAEVNNLLGQYASGLMEVIRRGAELPPQMLADAKELGVRVPVAKALTGAAVTRIANASFSIEGVDLGTR